jgi:hypothetical protein
LSFHDASAIAFQHYISALPLILRHFARYIRAFAFIDYFRFAIILHFIAFHYFLDYFISMILLRHFISFRDAIISPIFDCAIALDYFIFHYFHYFAFDIFDDAIISPLFSCCDIDAIIDYY